MSDDDLLTPRDTTANERLRADLLARTASRVRLTRRMRIGTRIALGVVCFAVGFATTFVRPRPESTIVYVQVHDQSPAIPNVDTPPAPPIRPKSAAELELEAEKTLVKSESARRFRAAGDRYILDHGDYTAALRCYRNFLDEADPADLGVSPDDTWLLTSLKRAREQENSQ